MATDINIVALLTQSFSQAGGMNSARFTDSAGRTGFDQFLGRQFDRAVADRTFTPRESHQGRTPDELSGPREIFPSDRPETPVRSDRPGPPATPLEPVENGPAPFEDAPTARSDQPVNPGSENPQTATDASTAPAAEPLPANQSPVPAADNENHLTAQQEALRGQLEKLNINPEIINTLLANLVGNPQANGLLQSLFGLLNASGAVAQTGAGVVANTGGTPTGLPNNLVLQNLIQAGLSEADALKVIEQAGEALASKAAQIKGGRLPLPLPPGEGLKGNGTEAPSGKLSAKPIALNFPLAQGNAETRADSNSKNSSNGNGDRFEKLAALLQNNSNSGLTAQPTNPFKLTASPFLNLNSATAATPVNVASAEGLAVQTGTVVDPAGKSAEVFKPVLAQTYGQRGSVEKTVARQIIDRISFRGTGSQKEINIKLDPPSLGSIRVNVSTSGESVRTTIITENSFVKQVIENNLSQLKDSLASQGIKVDQFSVLVGGQPEQNTAHQQESAGPKTTLGPDHEDPRDPGEELVLTPDRVIFNESTINVFA